MEVISSFTIDHTQLKPGVYVSRKDDVTTTFDCRITEPNKEPWVDPTAMHSLEHWMATWFRNSTVANDVVYVGPMGCMTGMYVIMYNGYSWEDMKNLLVDCLKWVVDQTEVPATTTETCGNCHYHNAELARWWAAKYLETLSSSDVSHEYTKLEVVLEDGKKFADS